MNLGMHNVESNFIKVPKKRKYEDEDNFKDKGKKKSKKDYSKERDRKRSEV